VTIPVVAVPLRRRALARAGRGLRVVLTFPPLPGVPPPAIRLVRLAAAGQLGVFELAAGGIGTVAPQTLGPASQLFAPNVIDGSSIAIAPSLLVAAPQLFAPAFSTPSPGNAATYAGAPITYDGTAVTYGV